MRSILILLALVSCSRKQPADVHDVPIANESAEAQSLRDDLVRSIASEVHDARVLEAMRRVPRHLFVPDESIARAYLDRPLPIGHDQTISQPLIVALMTEALELRGDERVLEIGTGSGYQAAVLSLLVKDVYSIELIPALGEAAHERLARLGYTNVHVMIGDGYKGWPEGAPFPAIIVTAAPPEIPKALLAQLSLGGRLVAPVGESNQRLVRCRKTENGIAQEDLGGVRFVPLVH